MPVRTYAGRYELTGDSTNRDVGGLFVGDMKNVKLVRHTYIITTVYVKSTQLSNSVCGYMKHLESVIVLSNASVINVTGAATKENHTIVIRSCEIAEVGPASAIKTPEGAV